MDTSTVYALVMIVQAFTGPIMPAVPRDAATLAPRADEYVLDSELTLDDCTGAAIHLPRPIRPLPLSDGRGDAFATVAVSFACREEVAE